MRGESCTLEWCWERREGGGININLRLGAVAGLTCFLPRTIVNELEDRAAQRQEAREEQLDELVAGIFPDIGELVL